MSSMRPWSSRSASCSRCHAGERGGEHGVARDGVLEVRGQAALLHELAERVAAAGGLEQIGPEQRVVDEVRRHLVERLGVVGDDRPVADGAHDVRRAARLAGEHDLVAGRAEAPAGRRRRTARPPGASGGATASVSSSIGSALRSMRVPSRTSAPTVVVGTLRRRGLVLAEDLLQAAQRVAQLELAEDVAQPGAIRLASTPRR